MATIKTSNLSQSSSKINLAASPSKVKLDIQPVRQNAEEDEINKISKKKVKNNKKQAE